MFQIDKINTGLAGLVGWRQPTNTSYNIVDAGNLATGSGRYLQDFSPLVTIQNIKESQMDDPAISDENFNLMLTEMYKSASLKVLTQVFNSDDFIENKVLFPYENVWTNTLENDTAFVGYEIELPMRRDILITVNKVLTSFSETGDQNLKVIAWHSSQNTALDSKKISTIANTEVSTDWNLRLSTSEYNGGKFYIGYLRSQVKADAKAVNREWDSANVQACFNTANIRPVTVDDWSSEALFDVDDIEYTSDTYGLNFDITGWKDYTNVVIQNKYKFTEAIGLQLSVDVLDLILKSNRANRIDRVMKSNALEEKEGIIDPARDTHRISGVVHRLNKEIMKLRKNFIELPQMSRATL